MGGVKVVDRLFLTSDERRERKKKMARDRSAKRYHQRYGQYPSRAELDRDNQVLRILVGELANTLELCLTATGISSYTRAEIQRVLDRVNARVPAPHTSIRGGQ